jgi:hypothetical protein
MPSTTPARLIRRYQEAFVDKMLSYSLPYGHVLYCMNNETSTPPGGDSTGSTSSRPGRRKGVTVCTTDMFDDAYLGAQAKHAPIVFDDPEHYMFADISQVNSRNFDQDALGPAAMAPAAGQQASAAQQPHQDLRQRLLHLRDGRPGGRHRAVLAQHPRRLGQRPVPPSGRGQRAERPGQGQHQAARILESQIKFWEITPHMELLSDREPNEAYLARSRASATRSISPTADPSGSICPSAPGTFRHHLDQRRDGHRTVESSQLGRLPPDGQDDRRGPCRDASAPYKGGWVAAIVKQSLPRLVSSRHYLSGAGGADVAAAQMLADRFGVALRVVSQPGDRFRQEWDKNRITGLRTLSHSWGLVLAEALKGPEVLLDGMNGGVLFGRAGLQRSVLKRFGRGQPRFAGLREHVLSELVDRPVGSVGAWLPQRLARREVVEGIRQRLSDCFAQYERFENPVQAFLCWEHVQHNTRLFTYGMMENDCVVCPLDTVEMVRFALSLPWEVSCDAAFQERAIAFRYPSFGDVPFSEGVDRSPGGWLADSPGEAASWRSIRDVLQPHLSAGGLSALEATRHQLGVVQKSTLLAQALYWEEHGCIPESAVFFGDTSCGATRNDVDA